MKNRLPWRSATSLFVCLIVFVAHLITVHAQETATGSIHGTVADARGQVIQGATVTVTNDTDLKRSAVTNDKGEYTINNLTAGGYTVTVAATGFASQARGGVVVAVGTRAQVSVSLPIASVSEEVMVEAEADTSLGSELAPVKSVLDAGSARTEITSNYISEYTSPVTDFADIIQAAPGTVSYTTNGIGNGQAKIFFRGFVDDDYSMTWDGVPFNDSNDPSHHSWAYVPAAAIGHTDFDRSPGTASDIGTSNFGGTIHFFSPTPSNEAHVRGSMTYGSWNTRQFLGDITSGSFWHNKAHFWLNGDYQISDG